MGWRDALPNLVAFGDAFAPPPEALAATEAPPEGLGAPPASSPAPGSLLESLLAEMLPDTGQMVRSGEGFQDPGAVRRSQLRDLFQKQTGRDPRSSPNMLRLADGTRVERDPQTGAISAQRPISIDTFRENRRVEGGGPTGGSAIGRGLTVGQAAAETFHPGPAPGMPGTITPASRATIRQGVAPDLTPAQQAEAIARFREIDQQLGQVTPDLLRALTGAAALGRGTPEATRARLGLAQGALPEVGASELARVLLLAESQAGPDRAKQDALVPRMLEQALGEARERREKASIRAETRQGRAEDREDRQTFQAQQNALAQASLSEQRMGRLSAQEREKLEGEVREVEAFSRDLARRAQRAVETGTPAPDMAKELRSAISRLVRPEARRDVAARFGLSLDVEPETKRPVAPSRSEELTRLVEQAAGLSGDQLTQLALTVTPTQHSTWVSGPQHRAPLGADPNLRGVIRDILAADAETSSGRPLALNLGLGRAVTRPASEVHFQTLRDDVATALRAAVLQKVRDPDLRERIADVSDADFAALLIGILGKKFAAETRK